MFKPQSPFRFNHDEPLAQIDSNRSVHQQVRFAVMALWLGKRLEGLDPFRDLDRLIGGNVTERLRCLACRP